MGHPCKSNAGNYNRSDRDQQDARSRVNDGISPLTMPAGGIDSFKVPNGLCSVGVHLLRKKAAAVVLDSS